MKSGLQLEPAALGFTADGTPFSERYGDVYHSAAGGPAQARHVFIAGNGLPGRWQGRTKFVILETGFGLGVNFLATWQAWRQDVQGCATLHFVSLEKHPLTAADLARQHATLPEFAELSSVLLARWPVLTPGAHRIELENGRLLLTLVLGDAVEWLPELDVQADAFYLDGFSPARNPELWSAEFCRLLARRAATGATLATWSVAGSVRRALQGVGFALARQTGFSGKRQMLTGHFCPTNGVRQEGGLIVL